MWIVGGCLVVAIGAVAYLTNNSAPASKDTAGTIVAAKRSVADGTATKFLHEFWAANSPTTDQSAARTTAGDAAAAETAKGKAGSNAADAADAANAAGGNEHGSSNHGGSDHGASNFTNN
jgi:hypothetical protein